MPTTKGSNISLPFELLRYSTHRLYAVEVSKISHKNEYIFVTKWRKNVSGMMSRSLHSLASTVIRSIEGVV